MYDYHHVDPFILSSSCPQSSSLVTCAHRIGGIIDPDFLLQCQIVDKNFEKEINQLKQIPIKYDLLPLNNNNNEYQEDLFLDIGIPYKKHFFNSLEFKQYNSWLIDENQWNIPYTINDDLII
ncbi:unnamed protein product [Adineta steineri]|uniref:Uncharacterized protein n=1 Tax=Adineta steineri TaxID=433720 RepID=A0A818QTM5_9BILA|nr:unnamed protein product [Adineta steineri]CAF3646510.1 unnamed protein product [Adineta steineri]